MEDDPRIKAAEQELDSLIRELGECVAEGHRLQASWSSLMARISTVTGRLAMMRGGNIPEPTRRPRPRA